MTETITRAFFIDANVFLYYLDPVAPQHAEVCTTLENLLNSDATTYTSHHAIEEVLHTTFLLSRNTQVVQSAAKQLSTIPAVSFIEPEESFDFAHRYAQLFHNASVGLNDCLLLQLMLDNNITHLYTYDEKLARAASTLNIRSITNNIKSPL